MKQIAKHIALSDTPVFKPELFDEQTATTLLLLTPNIASEGRRSAQHGGVPSSSWLGGSLGQLEFVFSSMNLRCPYQLSSKLLYDLSNLTTRPLGISAPTALIDSGAPQTWI